MNETIHMATASLSKTASREQKSEKNDGGRIVRTRILIVEDERGHAEAIKRFIHDANRDAEIQVAGSLEAYRHIISEWRPDIVLMDLNLPDGRAVEALTSPPEAAPFPILIMTSYGNEQAAVDVLKAGALDYVVKSPLAFADMPRIVERGLRDWRLLQERANAEKALRESEERYRRITETITDYIYTVHLRNGQPFQTIHGPGCIAVTGYSPLEFAADPFLWIRMVKQEDTERVLAHGAHILREGTSSTIDHRITCKNGSERWVRNTLVPHVNAAGELIGYDGIIQDITERKKVEDELKELFTIVDRAKEEWESTMDCINDVVMLTNTDGEIVRCNRALKQFVAGDFQDFIGQNWEDIVFGTRAGAKLTNAGQSDVLHAPTGRWLTINSYPFKNHKTNEVSGHAITLRDTTELKVLTRFLERTNTAIDLERRELRDALDQLSGLIQRVMETGDLGIRYPNPKLGRCFEVMNCGKKSCLCFGKEAMRCWQISGTYCGGKVSGAFVDKYGKCSACPVYGKATEATVLQIGEHFNNMMHMLEAKNLQLQDAFSDLNNAQLQALHREKMASIGQLAAGVAHEINNPMGFIMSNLGMLQGYVGTIGRFLATEAAAAGSNRNADSALRIEQLRKELNIDYLIQDAEPLIRESLEGAERVKKIVDDLKGFSRKGEKEWKPADINAGIESTLNIVWNELKYKATVSKEYGDLPLVPCNIAQLNQVFLNVLVNAAQAIDKQGEISIRTESDGVYAVIMIGDTGCGITPDIQKCMFDPFFTTKEVGKGTGLGLSIVYDLVKKHKGDISVQSEPGKGSLFTIRIPVNGVEGKGNYELGITNEG